MKKLWFYFFLVFVFFDVPIIHASETIQEKYQAIPDVYIWKKDLTGSRVTKSHQMTMIVKNSNLQFVYCIEPGTPIDGTHLYTGFDTNQSYVAQMSEEDWQRIQLLAYYGYQYKDQEVDHSDIKWYAVAQYLIWKTVPHGYDIYFSTSVYENHRIEKFVEEQQEMEDLLAKHAQIPQFDQNITLLLGEKKTLEDKNQVLSKFEFKNKSFGIPIIKNGNTLEITADHLGTYSLQFQKMDSVYSHAPIVYVHPLSQDVLEVGSYSPIQANYSIRVVGAKVKLKKLDQDTKSCLSSLKGTEYGLYQKDGTLVTRLTIGDDCTAESERNLALGEYYFQELKASIPYVKDPEKHYFSITTDHNQVDQVITLYDQKVKGKILIEKKNEVNQPLSGIEFQIFAQEDIYDPDHHILYAKDDLVAVLTTNDEGLASIQSLPLGNYYVKETKTIPGYQISDQVYEISLNYQDDQTKIVYETLSLVNYPIPKTMKNEESYFSIFFYQLGGFVLYDKKKFYSA